ncbi:MAG: AI-2E family transporter [Bacteroidaceae bacterium]|nr:AI-2E family transporter [Bacteroidaceae bacterium]
MKQITFDSFVRTITTILAIAIVLYAINALSSVLLPFFIAWFLAYMIYPIMKFFEDKLRLRYRLLALIATFALIGLIGWMVYLFIVPPMIEQFERLETIVSRYIGEGARNAMISGTIEYEIVQWISAQDIQHYITTDNITNAIKQALPHVLNVAESTLSIILGIVASGITLLYTLFILFDYERMAEGWLKFIPERKRHFAQTLASDVKNGMSNYFRGQAIVATLVGIVFATGFTIIDFPIAIGLGILFGVLNLVPYMQYLGFIPATLLALLQSADTGQNFWEIMGAVLIVFIVAQIIQDLILIPRIMGKAMGLRPAFILLALSVWGSLLGIIGMIIALPATTLIVSYYKQYVVEKHPEAPSDNPGTAEASE